MSGFYGDSIEQQPIVRNPKHNTAFALGNSVGELVPRCLKLCSRALVTESVETRILHQNVQAVDERTGSLRGCLACAGARNRILPRVLAEISVRRKADRRTL